METVDRQPQSEASSPRKSPCPISDDEFKRIVDAKQAQTAAQKAARGQPTQLQPVRVARAAVDPELLESRRWKEEEARVAEAVRRLIEASGVPTKYVAAQVGNVISLPADACASFLRASSTLSQKAQSPSTIALVGPRGTGKTHMACALVLRFCREGQAARYCDTMDYFIGLRATYRDGAREDESQVEAKFIRPRLLVLDEVQERGGTEWEDRMLTRLIVKRDAAERPTLLISNLTKDEFLSRIGESVASRMKHGGGVITCDWESVRGRINA